MQGMAMRNALEVFIFVSQPENGYFTEMCKRERLLILCLVMDEEFVSSGFQILGLEEINVEYTFTDLQGVFLIPFQWQPPNTVTQINEISGLY